jgi:hypothetical protein
LPTCVPDVTGLSSTVVSTGESLNSLSPTAARGDTQKALTAPGYCRSCGSPIHLQTRFCISCGAPLGDSSSRPAPHVPNRRPKRSVFVAADLGLVCAATLIGLAAGGVFSPKDDYDQSGGLTPDMIVSLSDWGAPDDLSVRSHRVFGDWAAAIIDCTYLKPLSPEDGVALGCISVFKREASGWTLYNEISQMGAAESFRSEGVPDSVVDWIEANRF